MKTVLIPVGKKFLVGGVNWHPYAKKDYAKQVRENAALTSYEFYTNLKKHNSKKPDYYGLIARQEHKPGQIISIIQLLKLISNPDSALGVIIKHENYYAVCVLNKMHPIKDEIYLSYTDACNEMKVISNSLGFKPNVNFDQEFGFNYVEDLAESLLENAGKKVTTFRSIPVSNISTYIMGAIVLAGLYAYYDYSENQKYLAEQAKLAAIREADPVPKYMSALMMQKGSYALTNSALYQMLEIASQLPVSPKGWKLGDVDCNTTYSCKAKYLRKSGTYDDLILSNPIFENEIQNPADLNTAIIKFSVDKQEFEFPSYDSNYEKFIKYDFGTKGQDWLTAGLGLAMQTPVLWPDAPGVPKSFKHPMAVHSGTVRITSIPLYLFTDFIKTKPINLHVKSFLLNVGQGAEENGTINSTVNVEGVYHVKEM